jgi:hypothetical protein
MQKNMRRRDDVVGCCWLLVTFFFFFFSHSSFVRRFCDGCTDGGPEMCSTSVLSLSTGTWRREEGKEEEGGEFVRLSGIEV